jgi:RNA polymerase sigma-70 factor (ECF subfamily)
LTSLETFDERQARIVEMKFCGGLTDEEIVEAPNISPAAVKRERATAKLLLYKILNDKS